MLRGPPIVDGNQGPTGDLCKQGAEAVFGIEIADDTSAPVGIDKQGRFWGCQLGSIDASCKHARWGGNAQSLNGHAGPRTTAKPRIRLGAAFSRLLRSEAEERGRGLGPSGEELKTRIKRTSPCMDRAAAGESPQEWGRQRQGRLEGEGWDVWYGQAPQVCVQRSRQGRWGTPPMIRRTTKSAAEPTSRGERCIIRSPTSLATAMALAVK